jgi:hypothetical protein
LQFHQFCHAYHDQDYGNIPIVTFPFADGIGLWLSNGHALQLSDEHTVQFTDGIGL